MRVKRWSIFILCALILTSPGCAPTQSCSEDPECTRVLFLGNSYTFVNDLPGTFARLARAGGQRVEADVSAEGGWMLSDHVQSGGTRSKIKSSNWDFVVLQEQSQVPASERMRNAQMYPMARTLVAQIRETGAEPVFFVTWAHQSGWPEEGLNSYESMQLQINAGYLGIARELNATLAPVGVAWLDAWRENPEVKLWQADGSHPSPQGTYLAACVFYAVIFEESPEGLSYKSDLSKEEAGWLQTIAAETVLKDKTKWNIR
jgi:hypothetical protein